MKRWVGLVALLAGCSRTPAEPSPTASTSSVTPVTPRAATPAVVVAPSADRPGAADGGQRCITSTPFAAPPIPAAAAPSECPVDPSPGALKKARVAFPSVTGAPGVDAELALSQNEITKGLMFRRSMPEDHGMLFRMDQRRTHTFWMQNTCIPLDMLFIDDDGVVVGIVEGAAPLTESTRSVGCPSSWVLEVNAGWSRRHGVRAGATMSIPAAAR